MNGCDTYAYVDSSLADAHAAVNADDDIGCKYMDIVTNAMPAYYSSNAENIMSVVRGLMNHEQPKTYEQIFAGVASNQVQIVSGEEDNVYVPGYDPDGPDQPDVDDDWQGFSESGTATAAGSIRAAALTVNATSRRSQAAKSWTRHRRRRRAVARS